MLIYQSIPSPYETTPRNHSLAVRFTYIWNPTMGVLTCERDFGVALTHSTIQCWAIPYPSNVHSVRRPNLEVIDSQSIRPFEGWSISRVWGFGGFCSMSPSEFFERWKMLGIWFIYHDLYVLRFPPQFPKCFASNRKKKNNIPPASFHRPLSSAKGLGPSLC